MRTNRGMYALIMALLACSLLSAFIPSVGKSVPQSLALIAKYLIYALCFSAVADAGARESMVKVSMTIACCGVVFVFAQQVLTGWMGIALWDGRLPFPLNETDGFSSLHDPNTGELRPHAFFQEPSYLAIYCTPPLLFALLKKKWIVSLLLSIGIIVTSSFLGVVMVCLAGLFFIFQNGLRGKSIDLRVPILVLCLCGVVFAVLFMALNSGLVPALAHFLDNVSSKINSIFNLFVENSWGRSSAQLRLLGNIELFGEYSVPEKIVGMGMGQYASVFSGQIETGYSSTAVNILLNCGAIGLVALLGWAISLATQNNSPAGITCAIAFFLMILVDNLWFNWYFFYVIAWIYLFGAKGMRGGLEFSPCDDICPRSKACSV